MIFFLEGRVHGGIGVEREAFVLEAEEVVQSAEEHPLRFLGRELERQPLFEPAADGLRPVAEFDVGDAVDGLVGEDAVVAVGDVGAHAGSWRGLLVKVSEW